MDGLKEPEIAMSRRERDVLVELRNVLDGKATQAEAARRLKLTVRQVRRKVARLIDEGDGSVVHGLKGKPSNRRTDAKVRKKVLTLYRTKYPDFGPTFAAEKLADDGVSVDGETLRRWLLAEGLWARKRRRDPHRSRRPRRASFGELVQMDASIHDWLEGRGETVVLITMIDDATNRTLAKFYPSGSVESHMDLLGEWLRTHGRPLALYTDRHSIFEVHDRKEREADPDAETQFGRALEQLGIELIRANSPQAKGRVERSFGTAQDRWVKELRLANARTCEAANAVLQRVIPEHNKRFAKPPRVTTESHRTLDRTMNLKSILSIQHKRVVSNDYVVRYGGRHYQLLPPAWPGLRGGRVTIECRLDGAMVIRFGNRELKYDAWSEPDGSVGGSAPKPPEFNASTVDAAPGGPRNTKGGRNSSSRPPGIEPTAGRSGRTPAEPYPSDGNDQGTKKSGKKPYKPPANHPWRR
jgi:transposase